jgi:hypothetical protein
MTIFLRYRTKSFYPTLDKTIESLLTLVSVEKESYDLTEEKTGESV